MPTNKTGLLCRALKWSGALGWRAVQFRRAGSPRLTILAYHRVVREIPAVYDFDRDVVSCSADEFEREMRFVARHFTVVSFRDLDGNAGRFRNPLIVTFDDGYRDNHDVALPILLSYGLKATFFVTTGYVGSGEAPWWDEMSRFIRRSGPDSLRLETWKPEAVAVGSGVEKEAALAELLAFAKSVPDERRLKLLEEIRWLGGPVPAGEARNLFMNWAAIRDLVAKGMEMGSHTVSHPVLSRLDAPAVFRELTESKDRLERETGQAVRAFAYPVGGEESVTDGVVDMVKKAGYAYACLYRHGVNSKRGFDPYRLLRIKAETQTDFDRFRAKVCFPSLVRW